MDALPSKLAVGQDIGKPQLVTFELTRRCRFGCSHCRGVGPDGKDHLSTKQCKKIIDAVAGLCNSTIMFSGGEPLERPDIFDLLSHAKAKNLNVMLSECGYLIDENSIEKLKNAGLSSLIFSLDGSAAETHDAFRDNKGSFDSVLNAARTAKKAEVPFQFTTSLCRINTPEIIGIAHWARQLGATCLNAFILVPTNSADYRIQDLILDPIEYESVLNELLRIKITTKLPVHVVCGPQFAAVCKQARAKGLSKTDGSCMGAKSYAFVNSKGQVQLCGYLDHPAGNLLENGFDFASIWNESELFRVVRKQAEFTGPCKACEHMGVCSGCRARAFAVNGDYLAGDPACSLRPKKHKRR